MESILGNRVEIRELILEDAYEMQGWEKHDNPLFFDYNFPDLDREEVKLWFKSKTNRKNIVCYGVLNEEKKIIGYMTIKNIRKIIKSAKLGIVFNPRYQNVGYGTEAIKTILKSFFGNMNMKTMYLDVAKHNKRAIRCYEKCGFKIVREYKQRLEDQSIPIFVDDRFKAARDCFVKKRNTTYGYFYEMKLERE